jgi:hypothetical protein
MPDFSKAQQSKNAAIQADVRSAATEIYLRSWAEETGKKKLTKITRIDVSSSIVYIQMRETALDQRAVALTLRLPLSAIGSLINAMARSHGLKGFVTVDVDGEG